jgi:hypothetical protein
LPVLASLDHDLSIAATMGQPCRELTGYDVVLYMEEHDIWPPRGVAVHSMNPAGAARMRQVIHRHYGRTFVSPRAGGGAPTAA